MNDHKPVSPSLKPTLGCFHSSRLTQQPTGEQQTTLPLQTQHGIPLSTCTDCYSLVHDRNRKRYRETDSTTDTLRDTILGKGKRLNSWRVFINWRGWTSRALVNCTVSNYFSQVMIGTCCLQTPSSHHFISFRFIYLVNVIVPWGRALPVFFFQNY